MFYFQSYYPNVGTLGDKEADVVETFKQRKVDLCSLQETRLKGKDNREVIGIDYLQALQELW